MRAILRTAALLGLIAATAQAAETPKPPLPMREAQTPNAVIFDPHPDKAHPAGMVDVRIPSHGANMNAILYTASGAPPHPVLLLFHGFPGNEQNLDLARVLQRAGWNVLTLHYRGSWGSAGDYSIGHCMEDGLAAVAWLRDPGETIAPRVDPRRIVVIGHSLGGMVAGYVSAHDAGIAGAVVISPGAFAPISREEMIKRIRDTLSTDIGYHPLGNATPEALADEALSHGTEWDLIRYAPALARHPLLVVSADDGFTADNAKLAMAVAAVPGARVARRHFATDHSYDDQRIALITAILGWLDSLPPH
jgi:pimeloyl-ACP methyl ester carboxylesterase